MDPVEIRFIRKTIIEERGAKVFKKILRADFSKNLRASLSKEPYFGRIHLAEQYL
jgi:hypothetical protein